MSGNEFKIKLLVDDTAIKDLEKRMQGIFNIQGRGAGQGGASANPIKNLMKLGTIATGVIGLVAAVKKISEMTISASPMLKAMLQLFNSSITLILRPIGDFIGFILRPIMLYFLRYIALPFYKYFTPWMQKYGNAIGQGLVTVLKAFTEPPSKDNLGALAVDVIFPSKGATDLGNWLKSLEPLKLDNSGLTNLISSINGLGSKVDFKSFTSLFDPKSNSFIFAGINAKPLQDTWDMLSTLFNGIKTGLKPLVTAWDQLWSWFNNIGIGIKPLVSAWDSFSGLFQGIGAGFKTLTSAWDKLFGFFNNVGSTINSVFVKAWDALKGFWQSILDFLKDPLGTLSKAITGNSQNTTNNINTFGQQAVNLVINIEHAIGSDVDSIMKDLKDPIAKLIQQSQSRNKVK